MKNLILRVVCLAGIVAPCTVSANEEIVVSGQVSAASTVSEDNARLVMTAVTVERSDTAQVSDLKSSAKHALSRVGSSVSVEVATNSGLSVKLPAISENIAVLLDNGVDVTVASILHETLYGYETIESSAPNVTLYGYETIASSAPNVTLYGYENETSRV